jgi:hypothetical protein
MIESATQTETTMKAIMQNDASRFFGIGQTAEEARTDAMQYTDTLEGTEVVEVTEALAARIEAQGGDVRARPVDGIYDVA